MLRRKALVLAIVLSVALVGAAASRASVVDADLAITKTDGAATSVPGGGVVYTIVGSNAGPSDVTGATVADSFPAALTCTWTCSASAGSSCTAAGAGDINDSVDLLSGGTATYTATCSIDPAATGSLVNTATISSALNDPDMADNSATDTNTLVPTADLSITKTDGLASATPGGSVTYTIVASNAGPSVVTGATVADSFPAALTCTWTCSASAGSSCTAAGAGDINDSVDLLVGGTATYTASCMIDPAATGSLVNTATVSSVVTDPDMADNSATDTNTLVPTADLSITKTDGLASATPGGSVTYTIVASNAGPSVVTGATVADSFPAALTCTWTCSASAGSSCTAAGAGDINDSVDLLVGGTATYTASCMIDPAATGSLVNTATVSSVVTDPDMADNSATDTNTLVPTADLSITKTDGLASATPGGSVTYTIVASNAGPSVVTGATVADSFPGALTCTWTCSASAGSSCTAAGAGDINDSVDLLVGGTATYTASCMIDPAATGSLVNTATVSSVVTDPNMGDNAAADTDSLGASADLELSAVAMPTPANPGEVVTVDVTVTNNGPSDATGVSVTTTLPAGSTLNSTLGCTEDPNGVPTCSLGTVVAGGMAVFQIQLTAPPSPGDISLVVASAATDPDTANDSSVLPLLFDILAIPTLGGWGLALLALLLGTAALWGLRR